MGGSETLVRGLFPEAEAELAACNGDATKCALHVAVIDEIDAVFRRQSAGEDSGEATRASVVNQILAKLDGINQVVAGSSAGGSHGRVRNSDVKVTMLNEKVHWG